ncbi:MAG: type II toxin-antitoxin system PemK/MazF family toxin [Gemmatimonadetes bacterium]|nr:type II toxin-antitoxin system PemK/MazF family toxin [Gemmatimonadota bacterium]
MVAPAPAPAPAPDRGDLVLIDIYRGDHRQCERRPALVVSPERYNRRSGLALMCAISPRAKGYPFEVQLPERPVEGVVLADHLRSTDWQARQAEIIGRVPARVVADVLAKLKPI